MRWIERQENREREKIYQKIAYLISKHDLNMVDYWLSDSD